MTLSLDELREAIAGSGVGVRSRISLEPLGGPGDKLFPPTYGVDNRADTLYATETRRIDGSDVECAVLDSVASQANRRELALLEATRQGDIDVPLVSVDFRDTPAAGLDRVSSLEAPHRIFDAILRDSILDGVLFRHADVGRSITEATHRNAAALFRWSPTTLLFGGWDSTGPKGGRGAKYERCITGEVAAIGIQTGVKTASRIDPLAIEKDAALIYQGVDGTWEIDPERARKDKKGNPELVSSGEGAAGRPSQVNHGNIAPSIDPRAGGITADRVEATMVLSFPALRRLRFPVDDGGSAFGSDGQRVAELAGWTALAALGLVSTVLAVEEGFDLRSRCVLAPTGPLSFELLDRVGSTTEFTLERSESYELLEGAIGAARGAGLGWESGELLLEPADRLVDLVARSQALAAATPAGVADDGES